MTGVSRKRRWQSRFRLLGLGAIALLAMGLPSLVRSLPLPTLPTPADALQQADHLTPEELTGLEIDADIRDRLRFDPAWQEIHRAVQQDIMILKWGDNRLDNPIWKQYGAKVYPLLAYYARSADPTRQTYGIVGIRALGKPYTTLWLEQHLQQHRHAPDFYLLLTNPALLLDPSADVPYEVDWQAEFGLDDPATRDRFLQIACDNLEPPDAPGYYNQFNLYFLETMLGYEAVMPPQSETPDPALDPAIVQWNQLESINAPTERQIQQAIALYHSLTPTIRDYVLVTRLGKVKAGDISPIGNALLQALAADATDPDQVWAIAELDRHGDSNAGTQLQDILNHHLDQLAPLSKWASYEGQIYSPYIDRGTQAYYLLLGMVEKYPQSRFAQAAKAYGDLRGHSYFGGELRPQALLDQIARKTPAQTLADWQNWLQHYPDHPGADDATYFLARSLQDNDRVVDAMHLWLKMMSAPMGDSDARYLAWGHVRALLDVGLSTDQIATLVEAYQDQAIAPLLRYALAVRYARAQDYTKALVTADGLDLAAMDAKILGSYYDVLPWYGNGDRRSQVQNNMQAMLMEQRQRWQHLQQLQADNTPTAKYELASDWAGEGGWKNGYLAVWETGRTYYLPTGDWSNESCQIYWICNATLRDPDAIRASYQQSSQNAIALQLYQAQLDDPTTPRTLREKTLYMIASTLLWQWEDHPLGETLRIHPPAGLTEGSIQIPTDTTYSYERWQAIDEQLQRDYERRLDAIIATLKVEFPRSPFIDDLLFSRYAISGDVRFLQQIVERYPDGDRLPEAQFLLSRRSG